jgi:hypothetical protein
MQLLNFATIAVSIIAASSTFQTARAASACVTADECQAKAEALGLADFYVGDYPTKGCFRKNSKAFFSEGTEEEMSTTGLDGEQKRIWCEGDSSNDLVPMDQLLPVGGSESSTAGGVPSFSVVAAAASIGGVVAAFAI